MRVVAFAALISLGGVAPAAACYGNCNYQGGYYQMGGPVVQAAPPVVVQQAPVYQAPMYQAAPVYQAPVVVQQPPVYQAPFVQDAPVVVDAAPSGAYAEPYQHNYQHSYGPRHYEGPRYRTTYYERGPEYLVSQREYPAYDYGPRPYYGGYAEPYYYGRPYYRPYYRRATVCSGGAYETGQAICGMRP